MDVEELLAEQAEFMRLYWAGAGLSPLTSAEDRRHVLRAQCQAAGSEVYELLEEDSWRPHRDAGFAEDVVPGNVAEEAVDVIKCVLGAVLAYGVTAEEFERVYRAKSRLNVIRLLQTRLLRRIADSGAPCAAVDLDEVLCVNRPAFYAWARARDASLPEGDLRDSVRPDAYERLKRAWRESGAKAALSPVPGAVEAARALYGRYEGRLVVLSARPVKQVVRVASDTVDWLEARGVPYGALLFDPDKAVFAARTLPTLELLVDDDRGQCARAALQGVRRVCWVDADGSGEEPPPGCERVASLADAVG